MTDEIKQPYEVLHAIGHKGDRYDKGSIVELTDEEAANIGEEYIKKYFKPIEEEDESSNEETYTPEPEENADEKTPESVDENTQEQEEEKVEPLSEPKSNE